MTAPQIKSSPTVQSSLHFAAKRLGLSKGHLNDKGPITLKSSLHCVNKRLDEGSAKLDGYLSKFKSSSAELTQSVSHSLKEAVSVGQAAVSSKETQPLPSELRGFSPNASFSVNSGSGVVLSSTNTQQKEPVVESKSSQPPQSAASGTVTTTTGTSENASVPQNKPSLQELGTKLRAELDKEIASLQSEAKKDVQGVISKLKGESESQVSNNVQADENKATTVENKAETNKSDHKLQNEAKVVENGMKSKSSDHSQMSDKLESSVESKAKSKVKSDVKNDVEGDVKTAEKDAEHEIEGEIQHELDSIFEGVEKKAAGKLKAALDKVLPKELQLSTEELTFIADMGKTVLDNALSHLESELQADVAHVQSEVTNDVDSHMPNQASNQPEGHQAVSGGNSGSSAVSSGGGAVQAVGGHASMAGEVGSHMSAEQSTEAGAGAGAHHSAAAAHSTGSHAAGTAHTHGSGSGDTSVHSDGSTATEVAKVLQDVFAAVGVAQGLSEIYTGTREFLAEFNVKIPTGKELRSNIKQGIMGLFKGKQDVKNVDAASKATQVNAASDVSASEKTDDTKKSEPMTLQKLYKATTKLTDVGMGVGKVLAGLTVLTGVAIASPVLLPIVGTYSGLKSAVKSVKAYGESNTHAAVLKALDNKLPDTSMKPGDGPLKFVKNVIIESVIQATTGKSSSEINEMAETLLKKYPPEKADETGHSAKELTTLLRDKATYEARNHLAQGGTKLVATYAFGGLAVLGPLAALGAGVGIAIAGFGVANRLGAPAEEITKNINKNYPGVLPSDDPPPPKSVNTQVQGGGAVASSNSTTSTVVSGPPSSGVSDEMTRIGQSVSVLLNNLR